MKLHAKSLINVLSLSIALVFISNLSYAQGSRTQPPITRNPVEADLMAREWNLTHIAENVDEKFQKERVSLFPQIKEDFKQLQTVNNSLMQTVFVKQLVDYKLISVSTDEIAKRAHRLESNLMLPKVSSEVKVKYQAPSNPEELKRLLLTLDRAVMSFVGNPLFNSPRVFDPKLGEAARQDLRRIVGLSGVIKTNAAKLNKRVGK